MSDALTPKQEAFALAYFETSNAAEAYRRAYDVSEKTQDNWIYVEASQLLDNPKITLRLEALQEQAARMSIYTRQKALEEYEAARVLAMGAAAPAAAVGAIAGKVKLFGLDKPTRSEVTGKDGGPIETADRTASAILRERLDAIAARTAGPVEPSGAE